MFKRNSTNIYEDARAEVERLVALEREQMRMAEQGRRLEESWKSYVLETERKQEQLKREQERRIREQEKREREFLREQERQARELEKHEAWLRKHDEEIAKLQFRLSEAERTLAHYTPMLENLKKQTEELDTRIWWFEKKGLPCSGIKAEYEKINEKLFKIEGKVAKAQFDKEQAARKLAS